MIQPDATNLDNHIDNPYVGPRTFEEKDGRFFFGRERESRELLSLVISEPLVVFYAQSGAGKSSLINARLIPGLREEGFHILPVTRVSGELPEGIDTVENIFVYNLLLGLDQGRNEASSLTHASLTAYLQKLSHEDLAPEAEGEAPEENHEETVYHDDKTPARVLIIDQFEEIFTAHLNRWQDRKGFFRQLGQAIKKDPYLWVVLTLREDYVANLDPYARILPGKLRARFYMERLSYQAAREVIEAPAQQAGRPFASGVARVLVDNLRQLQAAPGQTQISLGEYVEPVQLQVVCYQLWENLKGQPVAQITLQDLQELGDVDTALAQFYEQALAMAVAKTEVSEIELRNWFESKLITEAGTRGTVYQGPDFTEGMENDVVELLADQFLLRPEIRAGGTWYELVHDRFVTPILQSNHSWGMKQPLIQLATTWATSGQSENRLLSGSQLAAALASKWQALGPLVKEFLEASQDAQKARAAALQAEEEERRQRELETARQLAEEAEARRKAEAEQAREAEARAQEQAEAARKSRRQVILLAILGCVAVGLALVAAFQTRTANQNAVEAETNAMQAQENAIQAQENANLAATRAAEAKANADLAATRQAEAQTSANVAATREAEAQAASTRAIIQQNEALAQKEAAEAERNTVATLAANLQAVINVQAYQDETMVQAAPTETPAPLPTAAVTDIGPTAIPTPTPTATPNQVATIQAAQAQLSQLTVAQTATAEAVRRTITADMVQVPAGPFLMGSLRDSSSLGASPAPQPGGDEFPQRSVLLPEFYLDRTEVTNEAYGECVNAGVCKRQVGGDPNYHVSPVFNNYPVIYVSWDDAQAYCQWRGKRLPTEAEWEKAARGTDGRIWPWGNTFRDDPSQANLGSNPNKPLPVDGRPNGASPYGALDMAGNVSEWVADWYKPTYYTDRPDPDSAPPGPTQADSSGTKVIRGGSFHNQGQEARTADRNGIGLGPSFDVGFRCAWSRQ